MNCGDANTIVNAFAAYTDSEGTKPGAASR